jgi:hypothetical protein
LVALRTAPYTALHARRSPPRGEGGSTFATRLGVSILLGAAIGGAMWAASGGPLEAQTSIVGATTFNPFNVNEWLYRFYDLALVAPGVAAAAYLLLSSLGPLRAAPSPRPWPPPLVEQRWGPPRWREALETAAGTLCVALCVVAELALSTGLLAGVAAAAVYVAASAAWSRGSLARLAGANTVAAALPLALLVPVSGATFVRVASTGGVVHYPWLPAWVGIPASAAVAAAAVWALARSKSPFRAQRWALVGVAAPILLFMLTATLPGALGSFSGFDDAQSLVGARLVFGHGLWPWKDAFLLHGPLYDAMYGQVGLTVFSPDRWGSFAGISFLVVPFGLAVQFAFIAWFSRRRPLLVVAGFVVVALEAYPTYRFLGDRYVFVPVTLILLDRALGAGTWARCGWLAGAMVVTSIVTPEATVLMAGVVAAVVLADAVHARAGVSAASFQRTLRCLAWGVALLGAWAVFLAAAGLLGSFVDYYRSAISGHQYIGAYQPQWSIRHDLLVDAEALAPLALFLLTVVKAVAKVRRREAWETSEWVLVATAIFVPIFYPLLIDRMDTGHVGELLEAVTPFLILWGIRAVGALDRLARQRPVASVAAIIAVPLLFSSRLPLLEAVPGRFDPGVPVPAYETLPLGYTVPGAVDTAQILALGAALDRYAGPRAPVFDFVNEMGVTYFLLDRVPGARFYHVESAATPFAQELEVGDLRKSRPPVVVFFDNTFGLPLYDGITSMERDYLVSQYILDHYRPVEDVQGQLLMLRDDLAAAPTPQEQKLYFSVPPCNWGDTPDFFTPPPARDRAEAVPASASRRGTLLRVADPPAGLDAYRWVELDSATPFGEGEVTINADPPGIPNMTIDAGTLPRAGKRLFIRVGSCSQWHGYGKAGFTLQVTGGASALRVYLLP